MTDELTKRYQSDPIFHVMVDQIASSVINHALSRIDWFDAVRMADRIIFISQMEARTEETQRQDDYDSASEGHP